MSDFQSQILTINNNSQKIPASSMAIFGGAIQIPKEILSK